MNDERIRIAIPVFSNEKYLNYFDALAALGAEGVMVAGDCDPMDYAGLLLPGGGDVDPALYGQAVCAECGVPDRELDRLQLQVLDRFVKAGRPVFGICRGHQLINVYFGGTLIQHLSCCACHSRTYTPVDRVHSTHAVEGTVIERLYGCEFCTNSSHHQAVDRLGEGLEVAEWSDDGVVEAIRHRALPVYGVQWHPERMCFAFARGDTVDGSKLIRWFLDLCRTGDATGGERRGQPAEGSRDAL